MVRWQVYVIVNIYSRWDILRLCARLLIEASENSSDICGRYFEMLFHILLFEAKATFSHEKKMFFLNQNNQ